MASCQERWVIEAVKCFVQRNHVGKGWKQGRDGLMMILLVELCEKSCQVSKRVYSPPVKY